MKKLVAGFILTSLCLSFFANAQNNRPSASDIMEKVRELKNLIDEQAFIVVYERGIIEGNRYLVFIFIASIAIILIIGVILFYRKEKKEIIDRALSRDENIIKEMIEKSGEITQKQVVKDTQYSRSSQAYAILTMCRAYYTVKNREQVSKKQAALWTAEQLPEWASLIRNALEWREEKENSRVDHKTTFPETEAFVNFIIGQIR